MLVNICILLLIILLSILYGLYFNKNIWVDSKGILDILIIFIIIFVGYKDAKIALTIGFFYILSRITLDTQNIIERFDEEDTKPQRGNDVQNDTQGLGDEDENDMIKIGNLQGLNVSKKLEPIVEFVNNPNSGMTEKCRVFWNDIAMDKNGCVQEFEARAKEYRNVIATMKSSLK